MTSSDDAERRLSEALRAQAVGGARPAPPDWRPAPEWPGRAVAGTQARRPVQATTGGVGTALALALLLGALLGAVLALLSLWAPGLLPAVG